MFVNKQLSWEDASDYCKGLQADLPSVHSQSEAEFIDTLNDGEPRVPWIGLRMKENGYAWSDGTLVDFINWAPNEPNNKGSVEQCTHMITSAFFNRYISGPANLTGKWNDNVCTNRVETFFCKEYFSK